MNYDYIEALKTTETICIFNNWLEKSPKYTITIPTYNRKELLQYAVESALNQYVFSDYEILVLDNNPKREDDGELIMRHYVHTPRIAYYKNKENLGIVNNLNKLALISRTEWVVMLHSDDMLYSDFMININKIVEEKNPAALFTEDIYTSGSHDVKPIRDSKQKIKLTKLKYGDYMLWNVGCNPVGMTARRISILELGGYDPSFGSSGDMKLNCLLTRLGQTYLLRGYPLTCYRWMDNETLKEGVIEDIVKNSSKIRLNILSRIMPFLPSSIIEHIIQYQESKELSSLTKLRKDCDNFNEDILQSNNKYIRIVYCIIRGLLNIDRKWRYLAAERIVHL